MLLRCVLRLAASTPSPMALGCMSVRLASAGLALSRGWERSVPAAADALQFQGFRGLIDLRLRVKLNAQLLIKHRRSDGERSRLSNPFCIFVRDNCSCCAACDDLKARLARRRRRGVGAFGRSRNKRISFPKDEAKTKGKRKKRILHEFINPRLPARKYRPLRDNQFFTRPIREKENE